MHICLRASLACAAFAFFAAPLAHAAEENPYAGQLFGDLGGLRPALARHGTVLSIDYLADFHKNDGGLDNGEDFLDFLLISLTVDGEKAFGIGGNTVMIAFTNSNGTFVNKRHIGSLQWVNNIEPYAMTFKLYEAWMEQQFFDNTFSVLFGLHDLNTEFWVTGVSVNFVNPAMQFGQSFVQSGTNGPSLFPETGLALRLRVNPTEQTYAMFGVFEGIPGDPDHTHGTHFSHEPGEGVLLVAEAGITPAAPDGVAGEVNKFGIGAWRYTGEQPDLVGPGMSNQQGVYFISGYQFYHKEDRDIAYFLNGGIADGDTLQTGWDVEAGLAGTGWVPGRPDGEIGFAVAVAHNSDEYMTSVAGAADHNETIYELYYRDTVWDGVALQPDIQYVSDPGTDPAIDDALLFGLRVTLSI